MRPRQLQPKNGTGGMIRFHVVGYQELKSPLYDENYGFIRNRSMETCNAAPLN